VHHLGSRRWHDVNWPVEVILGENIATAEDWNDGELPAMPAVPRVAGSLACINQGELLADAAVSADLIDGWPAQCFVQLGATLEYGKASAFFRCCNQKLWATVIEWLYDSLFVEITDLLELWLGPEVVVTCHAAVQQYPAIVTVIHPAFSVVALSGTTNFQQIALQAFDFIQRPQSFGAFSTSALWYEASQWVHDHLLADGMQPGTPFFGVGHSYGGCVALILAARYRLGDPGRLVRYLTYGAPKLGDARIGAILARCEGMNLCNDDDLVTVLPPGDLLTLIFNAANPLPPGFPYLHWIRQPEQIRQDDDGRLFPNDLIEMDLATVAAMIAKIFAGQQQNPISGHRIPEYNRRIKVRCPGCDWPLNPCVCNLLFPHNTCAKATPLTMPTDENILICAQQINWFHWPLDTAQGFIRITMDLVEGEELNGLFQVGSNCVFFFGHLVASNGVCFQLTPLGSPSLYLRLTGGIIANTTIRLRVSYGRCP
jgi:hypothetical protein